uniref:Uncharacterized protein n=1 Tax=Kalanchoe fedtschenkoi TaxID=63787 RepID=A0A7N0U346_KALFE
MINQPRTQLAQAQMNHPLSMKSCDPLITYTFCTSNTKHMCCMQRGLSKLCCQQCFGDGSECNVSAGKHRCNRRPFLLSWFQ